MSKRTFLIVGGGLAGAKAASELRERGFDGRIVLIGEEPDAPYERPPLTKDHLRGESSAEQALVHPPGFYDEQDVELVTGTTVTELDVSGARIALESGERLAYDRLLLTTGAEPRPIPVPGAELEGIYYLRTLGDCAAIRARLQPGAHVAVIGAGWIGSEFAASARQLGLEVTLIDPLALPNERIFGPEIGGFYRDVHAAQGVNLRLGEGVEWFDGNGAVQRVRTGRGTTVECDFAVVGIGITPRVELARDAGLAVANGIIVDERLRTAAADVFAAGDAASAWHPFYGQQVRVEHWANALNQGPAAARAMLGEAVSYDRIPYFFSDQYDVGMEYSGYAPQWDQVVFRGDPLDGQFVAFWLQEERVIAGMNVNVWDVNDRVQALIRSRAVVDIAALRDPDTPLETACSTERVLQPGESA